MTRIQKTIVICLFAWMCLLLIFSSVTNAEVINPLIAGNVRHTEGLVLKPYKDPSNSNISIGYGYNLSNGITHEVAEYLLQLKLEECVGGLRAIFGNAYDEFPLARQIALVDMMYAMGYTKFRTFDLLIKAIKADDWDTASYNILYVKTGSKVRTPWAKKFTTRAKKVAKLLKTGIIPENIKYTAPDDARVIELPENRIVTIQYRRR